MNNKSPNAAIDVDVYYDFRSPYAYFASHRMSAADFKPARDIRWRWRPISIDVLLNLQAGRPPLADWVDPLSPPKRKHFMADVGRMARFYGAPLLPPQPARQKPALPLSVAMLLEEEGIPHDDFRRAVFRAIWEEQRHIADKDVVASCLGSLPHELIDRAGAPEVRARLVARSEAAFQRGIFGVPSFVHNEEVFFGADRLDLFIASLDWK